jgi:predicted sulfurtransferase
VPLNTKRFSETWPVLEQLLGDKPKDTPVLTYCTGGIRCVKVNAYLQQKMGFTNTHRLAGGIVAYERWLRESGEHSGLYNAVESHRAGDTFPGEAPDQQQQEAQQELSRDAAGVKEGATTPARRSAFKGINFVFDRRRLAQSSKM